MHYIDMKFKDVDPISTVENIRSLLAKLNVEVVERWHDSGIDHCWSLTVAAKEGAPSSNGKGITKELARASAYGEFIERLQCGLFLYKYQSIISDKEMNLHTYAPDAKYMTLQEVEENGQWMDHIISAYGNGLTRARLAKICQIYGCCNEDKILTVPFYSLFEDKYVYLPAGFVEQMYTANGCCAGNTREEAWVHALSEILERRSEVALLQEDFWGTRIPDSVLEQFPTAMDILKQIRENGNYDIAVFDISLGNKFPVVATRIINKKTQSYVVNTAADPILEIAVHRTLTEIFQGRNLQTFSSKHNGRILKKKTDMPMAHNTMNQLETGNGLFSVDFFTEEKDNQREFTAFEDLRDKNNKELLEYLLGLYRNMGRPVYVRNQSFLGFPCYKFVVPGISETKALRLTEKIPEFSLAEMAAATLRNPATANTSELVFLLNFYKTISTIWSRRNHFGRLAGLPISGWQNCLLPITLSYAAYRLKQYADAVKYIRAMDGISNIPEDVKSYFSCVALYLELQKLEQDEESILLILRKFCDTASVQQLCDALSRGETPFDAYLLTCDRTHCEDCRYREACAYQNIKTLNKKAGEAYSRFTEGQAKEAFTLQ